MGFRDEFYPQTVAAMIQRNGEAAPDALGNRLPITKAVETIAILGTLSPHIVRILEQFQQRMDAPKIGAMRETYVTAAGFMNLADAPAPISAPGEIEPMFGGDIVANDRKWRDAFNLVTWKEYLAGFPKPGKPYARTPVSRLGQGYWVPWMPAVRVESWAETDLYTFLCQMVGEWQMAVDAGAAGIRAQANANNPMSSANNAAFWSTIRRLTASMDVIDENPPRDFFDRVKGAVKQSVNDSLDKTAEFAGEAAAVLAEKTGEIAGKFTQGFFAEAGITAIVVAGLAIYLFIS